MNLDEMMEDDWTASGALEKDIFISAVNQDKDTIDILQIFDSDNDEFTPDTIRIKMEPTDETSDYHGSSSGSPSSSLSSPNGFKDEPLGLDVHFGSSLFNAPFSPSATSSHSPSSFGMMHGSGHSMAPQQQHSPLPSAHFSHNHHHHHHMVQHHNQPNLQMSMNQIFNGPTHQYISANVSQNFLFKDSTIYEGMANVFIKDEIKEEQLDNMDSMDIAAILNSHAATNSHDSSPDEEEADLTLSSEMFLATSGADIDGGEGGMGLAAAQQQLKARNKMQEMALRQHLITDQNLQTTGELVLSPEERRTLVQEGYPIPEKYPLTKNEEEALKIVRRKIKNKLSAQESRRKRKEYIDALESRLHCFSEENKSLKLQVHQLEASNRDLQQKLHQYESKDKM
ncbi:unnamed protein product [Caenorhabditis sp. 36 PRJEB53466]|nr:unnamed protein product [Caenorhabditis sp. 36 PRJEB53466]